MSNFYLASNKDNRDHKALFGSDCVYDLDPIQVKRGADIPVMGDKVYIISGDRKITSVATVTHISEGIGETGEANVLIHGSIQSIQSDVTYDVYLKKIGCTGGKRLRTDLLMVAGFNIQKINF